MYGGGPARGLLNKALQDDEKFPEFAWALDGVGAFDAVVKMIVDDKFREGLERLAGGDDLGEHLGAVTVFADHAFDGADLAGDFAEAELERLFLVGGMLVGHAPV